MTSRCCRPLAMRTYRSNSGIRWSLSTELWRRWTAASSLRCWPGWQNLARWACSATWITWRIFQWMNALWIFAASRRKKYMTTWRRNCISWQKSRRWVMSRCAQNWKNVMMVTTLWNIPSGSITLSVCWTRLIRWSSAATGLRRGHPLI